LGRAQVGYLSLAPTIWYLDKKIPADGEFATGECKKAGGWKEADPWRGRTQFERRAL
jgi:hypothetical protein